jgi:hypothetical protein
LRAKHTVLSSALETSVRLRLRPRSDSSALASEIADDELWALNACGAHIELERGLEFPLRPRRASNTCHFTPQVKEKGFQHGVSLSTTTRQDFAH